LFFPNYSFTSLYNDPSTNWLYATVSESTQNLDGVYVSKNGGNSFSFSLLAPVNEDPGIIINRISIESDGNLYYTTATELYSLTGVTTPVKLLLTTGSNIAGAYIVAKNNNLIMTNSIWGQIAYRK
jgi:ABC-type uncharacterized transport system permease subunit